MPTKQTKNSKNAKNIQPISDDDKNYEEWKSKLKLLKDWDKGKIFYIPVRESIENKEFTAPGYFDLIRNPMDLKTIESKIDSRKYQDQDDLYKDLKLICDNAILYNKEGTSIHEKALLLYEQIKIHFRQSYAAHTDITNDTPAHELIEHASQNDTYIENQNTDTHEPEKFMIFKEIFDKSTHWRRNIFSLPSGKVGKDFINEMTKLIDLWCNKDTDAKFMLYGLMILPKLILQKHTKNPNAKNIKQTMSRRLELWKEEKFYDLFTEALAIQTRIKEPKTISNDEDILMSFRRLMSNGKINAAMKVLENTNGTGILPINNDTTNMLNDKHPKGEDDKKDMILQGPLKFIDPIIFEELTPDLIKKPLFI